MRRGVVIIIMYMRFKDNSNPSIYRESDYNIIMYISGIIPMNNAQVQ